MQTPYGMDHQDIQVSMGDEFVIRLEANPTTGYEWQIEADDSKVRLIDRQLGSASPEGAETAILPIGGGGHEEFKFEPLEPGDFQVRLELRRPWEDTPTKVLTYRVHVVREDGPS